MSDPCFAVLFVNVVVAILLLSVPNEIFPTSPPRVELPLIVLLQMQFVISSLLNPQIPPIDFVPFRWLEWSCAFSIFPSFLAQIPPM